MPALLSDSDCWHANQEAQSMRVRQEIAQGLDADRQVWQQLDTFCPVAGLRHAGNTAALPNSATQANGPNISGNRMGTNAKLLSKHSRKASKESRRENLSTSNPQ
ncbi:hypothetical protein GmRootV59_52390 (plasmid) [Variovorax sp. V59]